MVRLLASGLLLAVAVWPAALSAEPVAPEQVVERVDAALIDVMQRAETLGYVGRYQVLEPILDHSFDYAFMARVAAGKHWRDLDEAQKAELVEAFTRLSTATFAARFDGYGGEVFEVTGVEDRPRNTRLVQNHLLLSDGEVVPINFLLRQRDETWRVVDVFLDAKYSELAVKRSEFTSVIEREGFDSLIETIEQRIKTLSGGQSG